MGLKDWLRNAARSVANFGSKVFSGINKGRDFLKKGWNFAKGIPVVGDILQQAVNTPIPLINRSVSDVANTADSYLNVANKINDSIQNTAKNL